MIKRNKKELEQRRKSDNTMTIYNEDGTVYLKIVEGKINYESKEYKEQNKNE